jgi:Spy/CpxP family protein refolding chaperone
VSPWKVILATMVIFICGVIAGAILTKSVSPPPIVAANPTVDTSSPKKTQTASASTMPATPMLQLQRANFLKVLDKQLELTPDQRDEIAKIMKASQERTQPLWEKISPQMTDEIKRVREEIRNVLTPDQRKKFFELLKKGRKAENQPPGGRPVRPSETTTSVTNSTL